MENNNINRISATGLKSTLIDELSTPKTIIDNEGLQYFHKYNILIPRVNEELYNLQEEMDNVMISNTAQDFEIVQLQSGLSATNGNLTTVAALAGTASINALAAGNLENQKKVGSYLFKNL